MAKSKTKIKRRRKLKKRKARAVIEAFIYENRERRDGVKQINMKEAMLSLGLAAHLLDSNEKRGL